MLLFLSPTDFDTLNSGVLWLRMPPKAKIGSVLRPVNCFWSLQDAGQTWSHERVYIAQGGRRCASTGHRNNKSTAYSDSLDNRELPDCFVRHNLPLNHACRTPDQSCS
jgi:hypothetical protein